jgi:hypothetical protein
MTPILRYNVHCLTRPNAEHSVTRCRYPNWNIPRVATFTGVSLSLFQSTLREMLS